MSEPTKCELCGESMPPGEEMFKFHGYSGPCPKPPLEKPTEHPDDLRRQLAAMTAERDEAAERERAMSLKLCDAADTARRAEAELAASRNTDFSEKYRKAKGQRDRLMKAIARWRTGKGRISIRIAERELLETEKAIAAEIAKEPKP